MTTFTHLSLIIIVHLSPMLGILYSMEQNNNMKILFGSYCEILPALGLSSDPLAIVQQKQQAQYTLAIEMIARGFINAGATMPTINAFFLRRLLHTGHTELFKEMLALSIQALLKALVPKRPEKIALCLGPAYDSYIPQQAPATQEAYLFHKHHYELCLEVLKQCGLSLTDIIFLHETIGTGREALGLSQAAHSLGIPLIVSFVVNKEAHLLSGENVEAVINLIDDQTSHFVKGYSLNCCAPAAFERVVASFKNKAMIKRLIGFYPGPYDDDHTIYDSGKPLFEPPISDSIKKIIDVGSTYNLSFIGMCCGFRYENIKFLAKMV